MMSFNKILTLTLLFAGGCEAQEENVNIEGSWAGCPSGQYLEINFLKDLYYVFTPHDSIGARRRYSYKNDTVYIYEHEKGDQVKQQFEAVLHNDSLTLKIANGEPIYLRLVDRNSFDPNEISNYYLKYRQRHKKSNCYQSYEDQTNSFRVDTLQIDDNFKDKDFKL